MLPPRYDSKLYEWQALCQVAKIFSQPVLTNVRESKTATPPLQSTEFDGIIQARNGNRILIEAKSFALSLQDISDIERKYQSFEFSELLIVAPSFPKGLFRHSKTRFLAFEPDLDRLKLFYSISGYDLPINLRQELETGDHHFRFVLARRGKGETSRFRNQVDKQITSYQLLLREINREGPGGLPIRIFWSTSRWAYPKELFFSSYDNHLLQRGLVFDIDGKVIHNRDCPCRIDPGDSVCRLCIQAAKGKTLDLLNLLGDYETSVVFSGRQGFHVYVFAGDFWDSSVRHLTSLALSSGIPVDENIAMGAKSVVTMPGSIHGLSMLRAIAVEDLRSLEVNELLAVAAW